MFDEELTEEEMDDIIMVLDRERLRNAIRRPWSDSTLYLSSKARGASDHFMKTFILNGRKTTGFIPVDLTKEQLEEALKELRG